MTEWTLEHVPASTKPHIVEIGSGNGTLLLSLFEAGYDAWTATGIDYSSDAVRLAESIVKQRGFPDAKFYVLDFLGIDLSTVPGKPRDGWDLVLDKGTFDAMALAKKDEHGNAPSDAYAERIARILKPGGYFLITCASPNRHSFYDDSSYGSLQLYGR